MILRDEPKPNTQRNSYTDLHLHTGSDVSYAVGDLAQAWLCRGGVGRGSWPGEYSLSVNVALFDGPVWALCELHVQPVVCETLG